jgi:hypothetical protein
METQQMFKTTQGFCHILAECIVFTRSKEIGDLKKLTTENTITKLLIVYGVLALFLFYNSYTVYIAQNWLFFGLYTIGGLYLIYMIVRSIKYSNTPIIERDHIKNVTYKPIKQFMRRNYFEIDFEDKNGKIKTRFITIPRSFNNKGKHTKKALIAMKRAKLI